MFIPSCLSQQTWRNGRVAVAPVQFDFQNKMATVTAAARSRYMSAWGSARHKRKELARKHLARSGCHAVTHWFNLMTFNSRMHIKPISSKPLSVSKKRYHMAGCVGSLAEQWFSGICFVKTTKCQQLNTWYYSVWGLYVCVGRCQILVS